MTTMMNSRTTLFTSYNASQLTVPPAATWNGGIDRRTVAVQTRVHSSKDDRPRGLAGSDRSKKISRNAGGAGQLVLGGLLGLTAVLGMFWADVSAGEPGSETIHSHATAGETK